MKISQPSQICNNWSLNASDEDEDNEVLVHLEDFHITTNKILVHLDEDLTTFTKLQQM